MDTMVSRTLSVHQEHELLGRLEAAGLDSRLAQRVIDSKGNQLALEIVRMISGEKAAPRVPDRPTARLIKTLTVTCHGNATASQLVAQGQYNWSDEGITDERFPLQPHDPRTHEPELFQFDRDPSWEEVLAERERRNLDKPTYEQGLYLGIQHPDEQREHPIVITHEPVQDPDGDPHVLVLYGDADGRKLYLFYTGYQWRRRYVFAGVRPSSSPAGGAGQAS